ncbi:MAG: glycosyl hydrolase [Pseudomonadota bacterium]
MATITTDVSATKLSWVIEWPRAQARPNKFVALAFLLIGLTFFLGAPKLQAAAPPSIEDAFQMLSWRNVGPGRGGRSIAAAGSRARPNEYYFVATGGGLWKTDDGGSSWNPVTDGQIATASVGAVAIDPSNPDIVYIGMGEGQLRANVLQGDGIYKSVDGGATWKHMGLAGTRTITTLRINPRNPEIIYAAALGDPFSASDSRGVFRSTDGGKSWEKILFKSSQTGAVDLSMDATNPSVLYATLWQVYRKPWKLWSGGPESSIYKSVDGGDSWKEITHNPGLPEGVLGKITIAVSPANPQRVFANIEAEDGGLYRSDDGGESWAYINGNRKLWQRSFYFMQLRPDPVDQDTVYVLSFKLEKSTNGGEKFTSVPSRHADAHDMWIAPDDPERMILADDGGASVSVNGGASWTEQDMPTAQIYRLSLTHEFPYKLCGTQQDNSSVCVPSRKDQVLSGTPHVDTFADFITVAPSENGYVAPHPKNPDVFFVSSTNQLLRVDRGQQTFANVSPYPYGVMGQTAASMRERWNWVFPVVFSPADGQTLYTGSQHVWRSEDDGQSWEKISPDLTRADRATLGETGGAIRLDQDGPEVYGTLYTIAPSPLDDELIWVGSDDGLVHLSRNGGKRWINVTPPDLPEHSRISLIDASHHSPGTAFVVAKRYEMGDRAPYVYATRNFGESWEARVDGLPKEEFVHSIEEDPGMEGLLYLGTERGVRLSMDAGMSWHSLSLNLPSTPVMGLEVRGDELAIATHGRSFYVLDGLPTLRHLARHGAPGDATLFPASAAVLSAVPAKLNFYLQDAVDDARGVVLDADGKVVSHLFLRPKLSQGAHSVEWLLRYDGALMFPGMILEAIPPFLGPEVLPGDYTVRITAGGEEMTQPVSVAQDPRKAAIPMADLKAQRDLALKVRDAISKANGTVLEIRKLRSAIDAEDKAAEELLAALASVEGRLYQTRNQSPKDKIAYPIQLNDRLSLLYNYLTFGHGAPTQPQREVFAELQGELGDALTSYAEVLEDEYRRYQESLN